MNMVHFHNEDRRTFDFLKEAISEFVLDSTIVLLESRKIRVIKEFYLLICIEFKILLLPP